MLETERLARSMSSGFKNFDAFYLAAKASWSFFFFTGII